MKNVIFKLFILSLTIFLSSFFVYSQSEASKKEHFIFHKNGSNIDVEKLTDFLNTGILDLDTFRFYDKRRIIELDNTGATLELYSAQELFTLYGKHVSEFTIMPNAEYKAIYFTIYPENKGLKPQFK